MALQDPALAFRGCLVTIDCGDKACFQGKVLSVSAEDKTITIERPLRNGTPMVEKILVLSSANIHDIKVIKMALPTTVNERILPTKEKKASSINNQSKEKSVASINNNNCFVKEKTQKRKALNTSLPQQQRAVNKPVSSLSSFNIKNVPVSVLSSKNSKDIVIKLSEKNDKVKNISTVEGVRISVNDLLLNKDPQSLPSGFAIVKPLKNKESKRLLHLEKNISTSPTSFIVSKRNNVQDLSVKCTALEKASQLLKKADISHDGKTAFVNKINVSENKFLEPVGNLFVLPLTDSNCYNLPSKSISTDVRTLPNASSSLINVNSKVKNSSNEKKNVKSVNLKCLREERSADKSANSLDPTLEFCGCLVSIDCGNNGYFQGKVLNVNKDERTITIERPLKNGIPMVEKTLILGSSDIYDIKVIKMPLRTTLTCSKLIAVNDILPNVSKSCEIIGKKLKTYSVLPVNNNNNNVTEIKTSKVLVKLQQQPFVSNLTAASANIQNVPVSVLSSKNSKGIVSKLSEKSDIVINSSAVEGVRISVSDLLLNKDAQSVQSLSSISASKPAALATTDENVKEKKKTLQFSPAMEGKSLKYKEFGEFRHFQEQEVPAPRSINVSKKNNTRGPCGIPLVDFSNGYTGFSAKCAELDDPIDFNLLQTDFDFDGNLALFNKHKLSESDDLVCVDGALSIVTKNFRNDENVLADPSRTISWTQKCNASSSRKPNSLKGLRISVNELLNNDVGEQPECSLPMTE